MTSLPAAAAGRRDACLLVSFEGSHEGRGILFLNVCASLPSEEVADPLDDLVQEKLDPQVDEEDHTHKKGDADLQRNGRGR